MSKITSKNLSYDKAPPPFLAKLQSQNAASNGDRRQDFHAARAKKPRTAEEEREDEPVVFDEESGETLTKEQWEEREKFGEVVNASGETAAAVGEDSGLDGREEILKPIDAVEGEKRAAIGAARKRKAGRVIGAGEEDASRDDLDKAAGSKESFNKVKASILSGKKADKEGKPPKKGKKIKLSFGDDD